MLDLRNLVFRGEVVYTTDTHRALLTREQILQAAEPHLLRIVGPNCIGYAAPGLGLNASFGPGQMKGGRIAAIAQSGAVLAGLADWGAAQGIGFSYLFSMGDMADVDFGDVLDMLARDYETRAVLMYVEGIVQARKFMSAARSVASGIGAMRAPMQARAASLSASSRVVPGRISG